MSVWSNKIKYPVYSDRGLEYLISVFHDEGDIICIRSFVKRKGWLIKISKWKSVAGGYYFGRYNAREYDYDVKRMVKHQINEYEKQNIEQIERETQTTIGIKKVMEEFEHWDGQ